MNKSDLVKMLREGSVKVTFTKVDGSERVMNCTLKESVIKEVVGDKVSTSSKAENPDVVAVIDEDKGAWRSFRVDSVKEVQVL